MAEEKTESGEESQTPILRVQKMYLRHMEFNVPSGPEGFLKQGSPEFQFNVGVQHRALQSEHHYELVLSLAIDTKLPGDEKELYTLKMQHAGIFMLKNFPEERLSQILSIDCASLLFPFTRQIVSQVTGDGGFMPCMLEPINFAALYAHSKEQKSN